MAHSSLAFPTRGGELYFTYMLACGMISIIVPCSHMAHIDSRAELHIKEDFIITIIASEDAIRHIIALLLLILFSMRTRVEEREEKWKRLS